MRHRSKVVRYTAASTVLLTLAFAFVQFARAATTSGSLAFTNTPLLTPDGNSEPAIAVSPSGTIALTALSWLQFGTNFWTGPFGATPTLRGKIDAGLQQPGRRVFGGGDADVDFGSTGTIHATTLIFIVNKAFTSFQLGVSAIRCPNGDSTSLNLATCAKLVPSSSV